MSQNSNFTRLLTQVDAEVIVILNDPSDAHGRSGFAIISRIQWGAGEAVVRDNHHVSRDRPDGTEPHNSRKRAIRSQIEDNQRNSEPPLAHVRLATFGEALFILLEQNGAGGVVPGNRDLERETRWFAKQRRNPSRHYKPADFTGADLRNVDLCYADLAGASLADADLRNAQLAHASLIGAELSNALINSQQLTECDLLVAPLPAAPAGPPFAGYVPTSCAELLWIMSHGQSLEGASSYPPTDLLTDVNLAYLELSGIDFSEWDLSHCVLVTEMEEKYFATSAANNQKADRSLYDDVSISNLRQLIWIQLRDKALGRKTNRFANANFERAKLRQARLDGADLSGAKLAFADMTGASMKHVTMPDADCIFASFRTCNMTGLNAQSATFTCASFVEATMISSHCEDATFSNANMARANLLSANLHTATLDDANLSSAILTNARLHAATLFNANLQSANLQRVDIDPDTNLDGVQLDSHTLVGEIKWLKGPLLTGIDWERMPTIGDEEHLNQNLLAKERASQHSLAAKRLVSLKQIRYVMRAYHDLSTALANQRVTIAAGQYRYREQSLQLRVLMMEKRRLSAAFSLVLKVVAGYGERPRNAAALYLIIVLMFAEMMFGVGVFLNPVSHLSFIGAIILSVTSFHGRGFFPNPPMPGGIILSSPIVWLTTAESVLGLFIELTFIATFTKRFLN